MKKFVIPTLIALSLTACNESMTFSQNDKTGTTVATVNGVKIVSEDVETNLSALPANLILGREAEIKASIIDRLVEQELVLQDADKSKVENNAEFQKIKADVMRNLAYNFMVTKAVEKAVSEEALLAEYEANKASYAYPTVKARHILVSSEDEAKSIIKDLEAGKDFAAIAKVKSADSSAEEGGDLGWFKPNDMVASFSEAAFNLEAGSFSKTPVQTQFGWHVILVEERNDNNVATFEMVKQPLQQNMTNTALRDYINGLKEKAKIEVVSEVPAAETATEASN